MNEIISHAITCLCENGINAAEGYLHTDAQRPVGIGKVFVYPEKLYDGRLYIAADVYSSFEGDMSGCMQLAQTAARCISESVPVNDLSIRRLEYNRESMGYSAQITFNTVCEDMGVIPIRFYGFKDNDELYVSASVFSVLPEPDYSAYPIETIFAGVPYDVLYGKLKYTVTLEGVKGGLGNLLAQHDLFDMDITLSGIEFRLKGCFVKKSEGPFGGTLTIVGYGV